MGILLDTDHPDYQKDPDTKIVINKNTGGFEEYKAKRQRGKEFNQMKNDIHILQMEVEQLRRKLEGITS